MNIINLFQEKNWIHETSTPKNWIRKTEKWDPRDCRTHVMGSNGIHAFSYDVHAKGKKLQHAAARDVRLTSTAGAPRRERLPMLQRLDCRGPDFLIQGVVRQKPHAAACWWLSAVTRLGSSESRWSLCPLCGNDKAHGKRNMVSI